MTSSIIGETLEYDYTLRVEKDEHGKYTIFVNDQAKHCNLSADETIGALVGVYINELLYSL